MFTAFERTLAFRYLRSRRQEGFISLIAWLSFIGIALGVATLIIVMAVMNGFRSDLMDRIIGVTGHVNAYARGSDGIANYEVWAERLGGIDGVVRADPLVEGQAMVAGNQDARGAVVMGMRAQDIRTLDFFDGKIVRGSLADYGAMGEAGSGIAIGSRMARRFGVSVGDPLRLIAPQGNATAFGTIPRVASFPVAAVFDVGMFEYDSSFIFMPLPIAQRFFRTGEGASTLQIRVEDPDALAPYLRVLRQASGGDLRYVTWRDRNQTFFNALEVERNVMFLILTLIILVAALNIVSSMVMLVKDKGRDIAILRTMGATQGSIMRAFFLTGFSIGAIGTTIGSILGIAFAMNIEAIRQFVQNLLGVQVFQAEVYFLASLPSDIQANETIAVIIMALILTILATLYPSWRAARLDPVEALRYE